MKVGAGLSVNAEKFGSFTAQLFSLNVASEVLMLQNIFSLTHECNFQYNGLLTNSVFSDDPPFISILYVKTTVTKTKRNLVRNN